MSPVIPWSAGRWPKAGRCVCGATVYPDGFRDRASWGEFQITGRCQSCQDVLFFSPSVADGRVRYPIRRGVLGATRERGGAVVEVGLLPFIFVAPEARIAWQVRWLLRAGSRLAPLDPWGELHVLEPVLGTHQVRLTEVDDVDGPEVRAALDVDLAIVGDAAAQPPLARLPLRSGALCLALADALPWQALYGAPLPALLVRWAGAGEGASVLGACARLAVGLEPPGPVKPLRLLLGAHRARFPELDRDAPEPD